MVQVVCTLENAGSKINGVHFTMANGQMTSEDITDAVAADFCKIPGYKLLGDEPAAVATGGKGKGKPADGTTPPATPAA